MRLTNALITITLLVLFVACSSEHDHLDIGGFEVMANNEVIFSQSGTVVTGQVTIPAGTVTDEMTVVFRDADGSALTITDDDYRMEILSDNTQVLSTELTGRWTFRLNGVSQGTAQINVNILHGSHYDFESRPVPANVTAPATSAAE